MGISKTELRQLEHEHELAKKVHHLSQTVERFMALSTAAVEEAAALARTGQVVEGLNLETLEVAIQGLQGASKGAVAAEAMLRLMIPVLSKP